MDLAPKPLALCGSSYSVVDANLIMNHRQKPMDAICTVACPPPFSATETNVQRNKCDGGRLQVTSNFLSYLSFGLLDNDAKEEQKKFWISVV